jgi:hypothetical protein
MPNLLSLPRELRDDIYDLVFRSSLTLKKAHLPRIRISKKKTSDDESHGNWKAPHPQHDNLGGAMCVPGDTNDAAIEDAVYYAGEEAIRYPNARPVPPTDPLLRVNHQIRAEMQEAIQKKPVQWRIRLSFRDDKELLYPTWMSMPAFTDRIDTLDVEIRVRKKKTASLFSTTSSIISNTSSTYARDRNEGDVFFGGFALLQRLLERGPSFVNKKKVIDPSHAPMTIGCVTLHLLPKDLEYQREPKELMDESTEWVDQLLTDKDETGWNDRDKNDEWQRIDSFLHFFAERIERFAFEVEGMRKEWLLKDAMAERDERTTRRVEREERAAMKHGENDGVAEWDVKFICGTKPNE